MSVLDGIFGPAFGDLSGAQNVANSPEFHARRAHMMVHQAAQAPDPWLYLNAFPVRRDSDPEITARRGRPWMDLA